MRPVSGMTKYSVCAAPRGAWEGSPPVLALALWPSLLRAGDGKSTLARGKLQLNVTDCGPANLLPTFRALSSSGESIEHVGPALVPQQSGTEVGFFDITCPDDIFENPLPTENARHLP